MAWENAYVIQLAEEWDEWQVLVSTNITLREPQKEEI
jgi:hypothetical protein